MAMNKRKKTTAIVAGVTAAALLLGGTFAWTSISQQAKNETAGIVNVGGRLHDDFDGTNKDVYVENFTDSLNGGQPIYARIKLTEYMEVGSEAGQADNADRKAVPVVEGTDINNKDNWPAHIPAEYCYICETGDTCDIHDHWQWTMGGQTTYMPTFNKDKDSLKADINGTYAGTNKDDKIYYDDYVEYTTTEEDGVNNNIAEADKEAYDGKIYSVTGTEYYDNDTDTEDNGGTRQEAGVTHTAKQTASGTVILMKDWNGTPGNYWVYDEDGWAYWANPIMPGEATGLLLDGIEMYKNPGEKCYYAINVVGQFATVNDWEYFTDGGKPSDEAMDLLTAASQNVATVTVANLSGKTTVEAGDTVNFSASVSLASGTATYAAGDFEWAVYNKDLTKNTTSQIVENDDGTATLTVGAGSTELIIVAKATDPAYLGATGLSAVAISNELNTTDNMENSRAVALLTVNGTADDGTETYTLSFVRVNNEDYIEEITTDDCIYGGKEAAYVFDSLNEEETYDFENYAYNLYSYAKNPWYDQRESITEVVFADTIKPVSTHFWFGQMKNLKSVDATKLDLSNATDLYRMFYYCEQLTTIKGIENWNTGKATTMGCMFWRCYVLPNLDLSGWNTSAVEDMNGMFLECTFEELNLSEWNTSAVTNMENMFRSCSNLTKITGASEWNVSGATNMNRMFLTCQNLTLDCSAWDVSKVTSYTDFNTNAPNVIAPTWPTTTE